MTKSKSTKRALLASVMSLLLCFAMLVGSTFAWFTDSVSTGVNRIQSGNLDIDIVDADGNSLEGKTMKWETKDDRAQSEILWEPGCTYKLQEFKIVNKGNLALKYKVIINGIQGSAKLNEVIKWTMEDADKNTLALDTELHLAAGAETASYTISGTMDQNAGNEYMNLSIDGIAITVIATQDTVEYDSFNNQYDKDAKYDSVFNEAELREAVKLGGNVKLACDIALSEELYLLDVPELVLDGNGFALTAAKGFKMNLEGQYQLVKVQTANAVTLQNITLKHSALDAERYYHTLDVYDSPAVTLSNVTLIRDFTAAKGGAAMVLNGSTVTVKDNFNVVVGGNTWGGVNVDNSTLDINNANVSFTGGELFAWTEKAGTIAGPTDVWTVTTDAEGNIALTVPVATINGKAYDTLEVAVTEAQAGDIVKIAGRTHILAKNLVIDKNLTIEGAEGAVITFDEKTEFATETEIAGENKPYAGIVTAKNATVTLKGITVKGNINVASANPNLTHNARYIGVCALNANVTMENCKVLDVTYQGHLLGMQNGVAVYAVSVSPSALTLTNVDIANFAKGGIVARANVALAVNGGSVIGIGATDLTAQNGIQYHGNAAIENVTISDLIYTPVPTACAVLNMGNDNSTIKSVTFQNVDYSIDCEETSGTTVVTESNIGDNVWVNNGHVLTIDGVAK